MSSNVAVINFSVGGTLTVSGVTTFGGEINSIGSGSFQGITTTDLVLSGSSSFTDHLPTSSKIPLIDTELTNKLFVDSADLLLNTRITNTDALQKIYIDEENTVLDERITSVDLLRKTYVDNVNSTLDLRITSVDGLRKTYVDNANSTLDLRITSVDGLRKIYVDNGDKVLNDKIILVDDLRKTYIDSADKMLTDIISTLNSRILSHENYNMPPSSGTVLQTITFGDVTGDKLFFDNSDF